MCNIDQQKESFKNVAYCADSTWTSDMCPFQRANLSLYLSSRNVKVKSTQWARLTPRTIRDCIPHSRLAQYSNYEYDDARELSYAPMTIKFERLYETFDREEITEPWMLEEIDDLFIGFLSYSSPDEDIACTNPHETLPCPKASCAMSYESPFLSANNFEEMTLKLQIVSDNLKKIWDSTYFPFFGWHPVAKAKNLALFKSPTCQMFSSSVKEESDWLKNMSETEENLTQIKALTKSFKEQNTWIFKKQSSRSWLEAHHDSVDLSTHRRLYSAVLQGASTNQLRPDQNPLVSLQFPSQRSEMATETSDGNFNNNYSQPSSSTSQQQNYHSYYSSKSNLVQTTTSAAATPITSVFGAPTNYATSYPYFPHQTFIGPRLYSSNFIPNASLLNFRQTNYFPLLLQNAAAPYAPPSLFSYQRGTFPSYRAMVFPQRPQVVLPSSNWFLQPPVKFNQPTVNVLANHASRYHYRSARSRLAKPDDSTTQDMENIVAKTVSAVLDDPDPFVPVTGVSSDELELQALEQYNASNTNVFQELERQAAEQYETSENWKSPPKCREFGGCLKVRFRCVEAILGLDCSSTVNAEVPNLVLESGRS